MKRVQYLRNRLCRVFAMVLLAAGLLLTGPVAPAAQAVSQADIDALKGDVTALTKQREELQSELNDYETLRRVGIPMPELLEADRENERILKEYIEGERIDELVLRDAMRPEYLEQIHAMCRLLYPAGLNIDYFPTNFIVRDGLLYYIDYECNGYMSQWDFENWGSKYWSKTEELIKYAEEREHA